MVDRLYVLYAHVQEGLISWIPPYLAELGDILDGWFRDDPLPDLALPLVACQAVGGNPEDPGVLRAAVAVLAGQVGLHILDDVRLKRNRQALWLHVGTERAIHYAHAFQVLSGRLWARLLHEGDVSEAVFQAGQEGFMIALAGRDRVLAHHTRTWEAYWKTAEMASAHPSAHLAALGALLAEGASSAVEACRAFGYHLGLARHLLDVYLHTGGSDTPPAGGRRTISLPILYGLHCEHPNQQELAAIVRQDQVGLQQERVREILDAIDARSYLLWAALNQRKQALDALEPALSEEGRQLLATFLAGWFEQVPAFTGGEEIRVPEARQKEIPAPTFDPEAGSRGLPSLTYRSAGLGLRQHVRQTPLQPSL